MLDLIAPYRKALVSGAVSALMAALPLLADGVTPEEVSMILGAFALGAGITWRVPNAAK